MKKLVKKSEGMANTVETYGSYKTCKKGYSMCSSTLKQCGGNGTAQTARYNGVRANIYQSVYSFN